MSSTNCSGGRVGLIDITSVPALMMLGGAIFAWARSAPGAMVERRERRQPRREQARRLNGR